MKAKVLAWLVLVFMICGFDNAARAGANQKAIEESGALTCNPDGSVYVGDPKEVGELSRAMSYFFRKKQYADLELTTRTILEKDKARGDIQGMVNLYAMLKISLQMQGKFEQAIEASEEHLKLSQKLTPPNPVVDCNIYIDKGGAYVSLGRFAEAEQALIKAKEIAEKNNLSKYLPDIEHNLVVARNGKPAVSELSLTVDKTSKIDPVRIKMAVKIGHLLRDKYGTKDWAFNTCLSAVEQPDFPGAIGEEGAIVMFDDEMNPTSGITTRVYNHNNHSKCWTRRLTEAEIKNASTQLKEFYKSKVDEESRKKIRVVLILSNTFKLAACESILNNDRSVRYQFAANRDERTASMYKSVGDQRELIASEQIY